MAPQQQADPEAAKALAVSAYGAGFRGPDLLRIVAIGLAEGPYPWSTNDSAIEHSVGPWQINLRVHDIAEDAARDYNGAAAYAYQLAYHTPQKWSHWSAFTAGTWEGYQDAARQAAAVLPRDALNPLLVPGAQGPGGGINEGRTPGEIIDAVTPDVSVPGLSDLGALARAIMQGFNKAVLTFAGVLLIVVGLGIYVLGPTAVKAGTRAATGGVAA